ncbi:MAG: 3-dehydroquinate synthase [Opitutaceae bacterium]
MQTRQIEKTISVPYEHRTYFTEGVFQKDNALLASLIQRSEQATRVIVVVDESVNNHFTSLQDSIHAYFDSQPDPIHLAAYVCYPGGETVKNETTYLESLYQHINDAQLCRHSYIIAIGGGALLDMVGFAAATAHRGIRLIRLPTTSLSQADGGVGVKNGINFAGKKNFIGTFAPPDAIINDFNFLNSLPDAQLRDGFIEAIKVALIKDAAFFNEIEAQANLLNQRDTEAIQYIVQKSALFHIEHITSCGDPFERTTARPLDFGHWLAHKLEALSEFEISHGAAVAIGIALDVLYSQWAGHLDSSEAERILDLIERLGFETYTPLLEAKSPTGQAEILNGLDEFREHLGGQLTISLLKAIGDAFDTHSIEPKGVEHCLEALKQRSAHRPQPT